MSRILSIFFALIVITAGYCESALAVSSDIPERYFIRNVPFTRQLPNFCGPASLSSLLAYWGVQVKQEVIGSSVYDKSVKGTNGADLLLFTQESGIPAYSFNGNIDQVKEMVAGGYPVLILQNRSRTRQEGHFRVVVGYNDVSRTIILRDSNQSAVISLPYSEFDYLWAKRGRWAMAAAPGDKDVFKADLESGNTVLHMDLAQAYIRKGDLERSRQECRKAMQLEPTNPHVVKISKKAGLN
ncbi:MAG: C39 family peptidase [Armatimonadota bacterium]